MEQVSPSAREAPHRATNHPVLLTDGAVFTLTLRRIACGEGEGRRCALDSPVTQEPDIHPRRRALALGRERGCEGEDACTNRYVSQSQRRKRIEGERARVVSSESVA